jgi:superfamily II DNA or RNA helicase
MQEDFESGKLKKVIATDVWSTGVDFPQLSVLVRADARSSEIIDIQAPGRVVRRHDASGKQYGMVIDFMDHFDGTFLRRSHDRRRSYNRQGWEQNNPGGVRRTRSSTEPQETTS